MQLKIKLVNLIVIHVSGDKSISIRWVLFSSTKGVSKAKNLLISDDVIAIKAIKKLGIKSIIKRMSVKFMGKVQ